MRLKAASGRGWSSRPDNTQTAARQQTRNGDTAQGHGSQSAGRASAPRARASFFSAHPCLPYLAGGHAGFLSSAAWPTQQSEDEGRIATCEASRQESSKEMIGKPCKSGLGDVDISAGGDPAFPVVLKRTTNQKHPKPSNRLAGALNGPWMVISPLVVVRPSSTSEEVSRMRLEGGMSQTLPLRCLCMCQVFACDDFHDLIVCAASGLARRPDHNPTHAPGQGPAC
jgi:hypothetical protein